MGGLSKDVKALQEAGGISPLLDKILRHFLKLSDTTPTPEIERAHRALLPSRTLGTLRGISSYVFSDWSDKNEVFKTLASAEGKLTWDGHDLRMFQDFPMEIQRQRDSYITQHLRA
ncbi:hypothetical protein KUCAC02_026753 [Chaenocephalus aceratus]|nr:hypothetical protein KUCAC02_026753 [Chaenocephalus aceratus]